MWSAMNRQFVRAVVGVLAVSLAGSVSAQAKPEDPIKVSEAGPP
jgi:hypothetical protein